MKKIIGLFLCLVLCLIAFSSPTAEARNSVQSKLELEVTQTRFKNKIKLDVKVTGEGANVKRIRYVEGEAYTHSRIWIVYGTEITESLSFTVDRPGEYNILLEDDNGHKDLKKIIVKDWSDEAEKELNAVWISYLEFASRLKDPSTGKDGFTEKRFQTEIDKMYDDVVAMNMNAVVVHVRPFGDAMYPSDYFPWSRYISGIQGTDPGFDPLEYMIDAAHERNLEFHAWLNPYRVANGTTNVNTLSKDNIARTWRANKNKVRNIISYDKKLFFNPAINEVQKLIQNGIFEIVTNYNVDGIHFDDYFYPTLGTKYKTTFDSTEYNAYVETRGDKNKLNIADWRRENVNTLIRNIYKGIKEIDDSVSFGISPAGNYNNLMSNVGYYCDIKTWLSEPGYIDYIAPQIYWTFNHPTMPYDKTVDYWNKLRTNPDIKMYIGLATYRAGTTQYEPDWKSNNILQNQVEYGRKTNQVDGYMHFRYDYLNNKTSKKAVDNMLKIIN